MKLLKNILLVILAVSAIIVLIAGIFMFINGSLEAFPTEEQVEATRICGVMFIVIGAVLESISAVALYKINKR